MSIARLSGICSLKEDAGCVLSKSGGVGGGYDKSQDKMAQMIIERREKMGRFDDSMPLGYQTSKFVGLSDFGGECDESFDFSSLSKVLRVKRKTNLSLKENDEIVLDSKNFIFTSGVYDTEITRHFRDQNVEFEDRIEISDVITKKSFDGDIVQVDVAPGVESLVTIRDDKIIVGSDYGPTFVLDLPQNTGFNATYSAVVRTTDSNDVDSMNCEICVYDVLSLNSREVKKPYGERLDLLRENKPLFSGCCSGESHRYKTFYCFVANISCWLSGFTFGYMDIKFNRFNYFISKSYMRVREGKFFFFFRICESRCFC